LEVLVHLLALRSLLSRKLKVYFLFDNILTLAVCICCTAITWYYLCLWICVHSVWGRSPNQWTFVLERRL